MASGEISYLGVVEVTPEQIVMTPEPQCLAHRSPILADLVVLEAPHLPYLYILPLASSNPSYVLENTTEAHFERFLDESNDEQERSAAREALAEGPYTGVQYVVGLTPIPQSEFSFAHVRMIAIRTGNTWRTPAGRPMGDDERAAAARAALAHIKTVRKSKSPWKSSHV